MMAGRVLAKAVGVDPDEKSQQAERRTLAAAAIAPIETYFEEDPTIKEWLLDHRPTAAGAAQYFKSLFPFTQWIGRYNWQWARGDLIGGITLGFVVVPQAMAYALLAGLRPETGLYTSFTGAALYWLFGTSKDVAIGATAVVSLLVGRIIDSVGESIIDDVSPEELSKTIAALSGLCLLVFGFLRLDWLIELIPHVAIDAFVTGAAVTITLSQLPSVLGITGVNTRNAPYQVLIDTCRALPRTSVDAAIGLTALFLLQLIKWFCGRMAERQKHKARLWDLLSSFRMTFVILLYTLISFLVNMKAEAGKPKFRILGSVPSGFVSAGAPSLDPHLIKIMAPELPALLIILIIEHVAIGKSFGRMNNYSIVPSQEIISIGMANLLGPFLGGYPATGSFSGTAVLSKAGVRTPLAGVFNGAILVLALYALTSVFYYIPMAALAGLIVHAVSNLVTAPATLHRYWLVAPLDECIYFVGVLISVFHNLEVGIYVTVATSLAIVLVRLARAQGRFLGQASVHEHCSSSFHPRKRLSTWSSARGTLVSEEHQQPQQEREVFLPLDRCDGSNPDVDVGSPCPGVFIYRFTEGCNYLNQARYLDDLVSHIKAQTRQTSAGEYKRPGDRPWNEPGPRRAQDAEANASLPPLRAVVCDFSAVNQVDTTAVDGLMHVREQLDRWAAPTPVEFHFAGVHHSRWTRRALAAAGFGYPRCPVAVATAATSSSLSLGCSWVPTWEVAAAKTAVSDGTGFDFKGKQHHSSQSDSAESKKEPEVTEGVEKRRQLCSDCASEQVGCDGSNDDEEEQDLGVMSSGTVTPGSIFVKNLIKENPTTTAAGHGRSGDAVPARHVPVYGVDRPFFHVDLVSAVRSAVESARWREDEHPETC